MIMFDLINKPKQMVFIINIYFVISQLDYHLIDICICIIHKAM